jgi:hypothetical protein
MARRIYGKCPLCLKNTIDCCFHFVTRRRKVLRWDIRNVVGACHSCNYLERKWPDISRAWYIRKFGAEQYLAIVDESAKPFQSTAEFLNGIIKENSEALKSLGGSDEGTQTIHASEEQRPSS